MSRLMDELEAVTRFGSLGQSTRLAVLRSLLKVHPEGLNAGDIARMYEVPHNTDVGASCRAEPRRPRAGRSGKAG